MSIVVATDHPMFLLSTATTSYGLEVTDAGAVVNLYWGARLDRVEDLPYVEQEALNFSQEPDKKPWTNQEFPGAGGYFFNEPCMKALYPSGCRDTKLLYAGYALEHDNISDTLILTLKEQLAPLTVRLYYRVYHQLDVIDRWAAVENLGDAPVYLESFQSAVLYPPKGNDFRLTHMAGKWAAEYQLERHTLTQSKTVLESRHGISGPDCVPWFALDEHGQATETTGRVWAGALHWSGNWKITAEKDRDQQPRVTLGMNDYDFGWKLRPGETLTAPAVSFVYSEEGFGGASRRFHAYERYHLLPQTKARKVTPVMYNSWCVFAFDIDEQQQMRLADKAADMGIELFVMDDGWFGKRDSEHAGLGDWYPSRTKFPHGLKPLIDHVNSLGMDFGIWVEPEAVNEDSDLYRRHPEWALRPTGKPITEWRFQYVLNFAREDVCDYAWSYLDDLLSNNNIAYLKWDMNRYLCEVNWAEKPIDEEREVWTRFVYNVHKLFRRIQEKFPHVWLENCAGGGGRIDLGMTACSDMVNASDNTDPLDNLRIFEGYTQLFLPKTGNRGVAPVPDYVNGRIAPFAYRGHVSMLHGFSLGVNLLTLSEEDEKTARALIAEFKSIREVTQNGELYRLASVYEHPYGAYAFVSEDRAHAVMLLLGQSIRLREPIPRIRLQGLDPDALYRVDGGKLISGRALMNIGLTFHLNADFDSKLLRIEKEDEV